jgi:hypothetical protein
VVSASFLQRETLLQHLFLHTRFHPVRNDNIDKPLAKRCGCVVLRPLVNLKRRLVCMRFSKRKVRIIWRQATRGGPTEMRAPSRKRLLRRDARRASILDDGLCLRVTNFGVDAHEGPATLTAHEGGNHWKNMDLLPAFLGTCYQLSRKKARSHSHKSFTR